MIGVFLACDVQLLLLLIIIVRCRLNLPELMRVVSVYRFRKEIEVQDDG